MIIVLKKYEDIPFLLGSRFLPPLNIAPISNQRCSLSIAIFWNKSEVDFYLKRGGLILTYDLENVDLVSICGTRSIEYKLNKSTLDDENS